MKFPVIYEFGTLGHYATDGRIVLFHHNKTGKIKFSFRSSTSISMEFVPEDVKKKFDEVFSDPFTEIEWLKWKSKSIF